MYTFTAARRKHRSALAPLTVAVLTTAALPFTVGVAEAEERRAQPGVAACLWAGASHGSGSTVTAGGATYRCGSDAGAPYWFAAGATDKARTVPSPGAVTAPAAQFSAGARQPGTSYNDYCTGNQLIPGTDDIYQVVRLPEGTMLWKAAAPISEWQFDSAPPEPTWRTASLCNDGNLM